VFFDIPQDLTLFSRTMKDSNSMMIRLY